jgi:hypothetical protein
VLDAKTRPSPHAVFGYWNDGGLFQIQRNPGHQAAIDD